LLGASEADDRRHRENRKQQTDAGAKSHTAILPRIGGL
jgi:hypothetical protein